MHASPRSHRRARGLATVIAALSALLMVAASLSVVASEPADAADLSKFDAGNIISDDVFFDSSTMTEAQIQSFLNSKVATCKSGYTCLKSFKQTTTTRAADAMCKGYAGAANESAARIIYKVAKSCGVNPKVIIVMLQKEQGLVASSAPSSWAWKASMGYACPDTAACDTRYYGFYNQVFMGIWQLKRYGNPAGTSQYFTWYPIGKASPVRYHPNAACGSSSVVVKNKATAALYYYTPYQPNSASLAAGYGSSSNSCASYGNRNFYNYFTDWFGSSTGAAVIKSSVDQIAATDYDTVRVRGWAFDEGNTAALTIEVTSDGDRVSSFSTGTSRPDVGTAYPGAGNKRGFDKTLTIEGGGDRRICVVARSGDTAKEIGCSTVTVESGSPRFSLDSAAAVPGGVRLVGWALDVETADPIRVHIYADSVTKAYTADVDRPDLARHYPTLGTKHGFDITMQLPTGKQRICAYAVNVGKGSSQLITCQTLSVYSGQVKGSVDRITSVPGGIEVRGWAFDPDTADSTSAHIYVDGKAYRATADQKRTDVGRAYPTYGDSRGFSRTITTTAGSHKVCVYAIDIVGSDGNKTLKCATVTVRAGSPFGSLDSVVASGDTVTAKGWAIDPDTADPIRVHLYVNGKAVSVAADANRSDVGRVYTAYGAAHGFTKSVTVAGSGPVKVCAYAINTGSGGNTLLSCKTVTR